MSHNMPVPPRPSVKAAGDYTVLDTDETIFMDLNGGSWKVNLPPWARAARFRLSRTPTALETTRAFARTGVSRSTRTAPTVGRSSTSRAATPAP